MVAVRGLFETHLTVRDLERSVAFYRDVVGLQPAHVIPERHAAFLWIGGPGRAMLGLWSIQTSPIGLRLHLAFDVALEDLLALPRRLREAGIHLRRGADEPEVIGWMPAAAIYVDDPDGHSVEFLTMLPHASRPDAGRVPYSTWVASFARPAEQAGTPR